MFLGLFVLLVGMIFLLKNLGYLATIDWGIIWPVLLIALGLSIMANRSYYHERRIWRRWRDKHEEEDEVD